MKDNREKLEDAALNAVQRNGLKSLSFRTLADEIGIKSSSVHYHFPEKSDLARVLIERYSEEFFESLEHIGAQKWGLKKKLKAFIAIFEDVAQHDKLCLCGMMAAELELLDKHNRTLLREYFIDTEEWLSQLFTDHREELTSQHNARMLARTLLSGLEGALLLDRVTKNENRLKAQKELFLAIL